ncbi:MAG TPA: glucoamylase family protein [Rubricoccaceae bacterium]|nr:glucoamylase family protein [Rubricoccaceae bacterium]
MAEPAENPFNPEALAAYARRLAQSHTVNVAPKRLARPTAFLLRDAYRGLPEAYAALAAAARRKQSLTPAAHWLLDNFYLIRDQVRQVREDLPWNYYRILPRLEGGPEHRRPRVFELMRALAAQTDNAVGPRQLLPFAKAYQETAPLLMSELWALPSSLRLVMLQNLGGLAERVVADLAERADAEAWAKRIEAQAEADPAGVVTVLAELAEGRASLSDAFVVSLAGALEGRGAAAVPTLDWLERRMSARGISLDAVRQRETHRQTHRQVSVANAIQSLREANLVEWKDLVETLSVSEAALRHDPAGVYAAMDFATRDRYRHRVEDLARSSPVEESAVAARAVLRATEAAADRPDTDEPVDHVGYWLIGPGQRRLEKELGYRPPLRHRLTRVARRRPALTHFGLLLSWAAVLYAGLVVFLGGTPLTTAEIALAALAAFLPVLDLSVSITNSLLTRVLPPDILPKMGFEEGIPPAYRTLVAVPTLIDGPENARRQIERLEVHALANPDPHLRFALLTDFPDAPAEHQPGDRATLEAARAAVRALNERYRDKLGDKFFLLHRERRWNPSEGVWMGWERKRGKIEELLRLLRDPTEETSYTVFEGDFKAIASGDAFRYLLTLDADTEMPPEAGVDLVRTAAHPLNRPRYNALRTRVVRGYGVLQPRIGIGAEAGHRTRFARVFAGFSGVDPYTTAVSDVYQDLFREGIFTGKGLLDVDAFLTTLDRVLPENRILSHDLLEGLHARAALVTDVVLFDDYPSHYSAFAKRLHRWVRGDWQIFPWLFPVVPAAQGTVRKNPIARAGRWRIFDNLRRSATPPALLLFLVLGWTVLPGPGWLWTLLALGVLAFPIYAPFTSALLTHPRDAVWSSYLRGVIEDTRQSTVQVFLSVVFLAHEAILMTDAIARTLWRLLITKRKLLEWVTAHQAEIRRGRAPGLWLSPLFSLVVLALTLWAAPIDVLLAAPFLVAWAIAPWVADAISRPEERHVHVLEPAETARLRLVARRTWRYFDAFVGPEDHWLPPDNFQEQPFKGRARRTSPTNIGLALLAAQAAYDLGYLTRTDLADRLDAQLSALARLDRHRGHFFNWYTTETATPLPPRYVSTVDSGNLAACLVALRQALLETRDAPWPAPGLADALRDALRALDETLALPRADLTGESTRPVAEAVEALRRALPERFSDVLAERHAQVRALEALADTLVAAAAPLPIRSEADREEFVYWAGQIAGRLTTERAELEHFAPWLLHGDAAGDELKAEALARPGTLGRLLTAVREVLGRDGHLGPAHDALATAEATLSVFLERAEGMAVRAERLAFGMDFSMLYRKERGLLSIGYDADHARLDVNDYGLLASEARLASLIAIGKGDVPVEHWFRLARTTGVPGGEKVLLSWSGTMFEYLMPILLTRLYPNTLLEGSCRAAVAVQRAWGRQKGLPWGISESAYFRLDPELTYQYRAFGVPGLGLDRGLAKHYVAAPYATLLALPVDLEAALANLDALQHEGGYGVYGYYDAIDYTPSRLPPDQPRAVVKTYMAHHQGMGLLALANVLGGAAFQRRFHGAPLVRSVEVLLQERVPREIERVALPEEMGEIEPVETTAVRPAVRHVPVERLYDETPHGALLSNGRHTAFVTAAGAGYSRRAADALTRWRPDPAREDHGAFLYVRDLDSGRVWSAGAQPIAGQPDRYEAWFHLNKVEIARVEDWIETFTEVSVSPEDDVEVRRYTVTNYGDTPRRLELTSYAEVALNDVEADLAHPAFSKLFVETEYVPEHHALLAHRRKRKPDDPERWLFHALADAGLDAVTGPLEVETDRAKFLGRGRTCTNPAALDPGVKLSGTVGAVLDPVVALRRVVEVGPREQVSLAFALGTAASREEALRLADRYDHPDAVQRAVELASVYGLVELQHLGLTGKQALYAQELASALLFAPRALRADERTMVRNRRSQPGLWAYGISGDLPIVLLRIGKVEHMESVRFFLKAHAYWRQKGVQADLVILNEHPPSYADELQKAILDAIQASPGRNLQGARGGLHLRRAEHLPPEDLTLLLSVARVVVEGTLPELPLDGPPPALPPASIAHPAVPEREALALPVASSDGRTASNGYGAFSEDGTEYVIRLGGPGEPDATPLPWSNVVANERAGFVVTEGGSGFTWAYNSQQNKLTPWSNDPVSDPVEEALYVRDEEAGVFWSPTPRPVPGPGSYEVRHGFGYSVFHHGSHDLDQETTLFVPREDPVKVIRLRLTNRSDRPRRLSVFRYQAWVLADQRRKGAPYVVVQEDRASGVVFAWNRFNAAYGDRVAFAAALRPGIEGAEPLATADRVGFLGRLGSPENPQALARAATLDGRGGPGLDPCAAFQVPLTLAPGETAEVVFLLGQATTRAEARALVERFDAPRAAEDALEEARAFWREALTALRVETPEPALNDLVNGWLLYQALACRIWGRSAFYQSGGAFGFRDQLQDAMALLFTRPDLARRQLLLHAAHQFEEGDVLHWWHPAPDARPFAATGSVGAGIRTRFSDDLLWLPYAAATYVEATGDVAVLDEEVRFLTARLLEEREDEVYLNPGVGGTGSVFEHCCRALDRSLTAGPHGIPLIGTGDWNDGMNRVGHEGKGESVWLGFFLYDLLGRFIPLCEARGETERAERYREYREALHEALNADGWDGAWYRRAFYDDGAPLGSATSDECRIDAIAQGWAVLSGAAPPDRAARALDAALEHLVDREAGIVRLLTPPFDKTPHDPGYIKGYLPGVRENGGQYTHGVLWLLQALLEHGRTAEGAELLAMISPVARTDTPEDTERYLAEPYAVAADVYGATPHEGRGGWTWYTGSAGWLYRVVVESLLGLRLEGGDTLVIRPHLPPAWPEARVRYRHGTGPEAAVYELTITNAGGASVTEATLDDEPAEVVGGAARVPLEADRRAHRIHVVLGAGGGVETNGHPAASSGKADGVRAQSGSA